MEGLGYALVLVLAATGWVIFVAVIMWLARQIPQAFKSIYDILRRR